MKQLDITGQVFGKLTVINRLETKGRSMWKCKCSCGTIAYVRLGDLRNGKTQSCGCLRRRSQGERQNKTRLYRIWSGIKDRCTNPQYHHYMDYGGRGITICREWQNDYLAFRDWALANGYRDDLSIDRVDVNGGYSPENCRWATSQKQANNRRNNKLIEVNGEVQTLAEWSRRSGISVATIHNRLKSGWNPEDAVKRSVKTWAALT